MNYTDALLQPAQVAELVDALASGASARTGVGSSPLLGTIVFHSCQTLNVSSN